MVGSVVLCIDGCLVVSLDCLKYCFFRSINRIG
jgi:hypothetical protein